MKIVFLYAGQGSQKVGMGKDFYETYPEYQEFADSVSLDFDVLKMMHEGPISELSSTEHTQAAMAIFAAGVTKLLKSKEITPDTALGLSLGEYGALYAAGVFGAEEYVKLTAFRGKKMAEAAGDYNCSMSAVLGLDDEVVEEVCRSYTGADFVVPANYNCPGQVVICGSEAAVAWAEEELKAKGAKRCIRLNVSGPFHTKIMAPAGEALKTYFEQMNFNEPNIKLMLNYTGDFYKGEDLKENLVLQVQNSVKLTNQLTKLLQEGADYYIEIGPGNTLSGFIKKTAKALGVEANVLAIDTVEDFEKVVGEING